MRHNALLGHGLAVQAIRANAGAGTKAGPAENLGHAVPITDSPENVKAAIAATRALNIYFLGPMFEGRYDDAYLKSAGKDTPKFTESDMKIIAAPVDFVGINVYIPLLLAKASDKPLLIDCFASQIVEENPEGLGVLRPGESRRPIHVTHPLLSDAYGFLKNQIVRHVPIVDDRLDEQSNRQYGASCQERFESQGGAAIQTNHAAMTSLPGPPHEARMESAAGAKRRAHSMPRATTTPSHGSAPPVCRRRATQARALIRSVVRAIIHQVATVVPAEGGILERAAAEALQ